MRTHIIQHGTDGTGHQLHGLFSCLILHGVNGYYFYGYSFMRKPFRFEHIHGKVKDDVELYMKDIVKQFIRINRQDPCEYTHHVHAHEIYNIPINVSQNTLYSLDNSYYFYKIPNMNPDEWKIHSKNIDIYKTMFVNEKLPKNRLCEDNIVIHFRQGDAITTGRGTDVQNHQTNLLIALTKTLSKYKGYTYYLHTDGDVSFFTNVLTQHSINYVLYEKDEPIMNVLSDFIHSKIFFSGCSGLSTLCTFLGNHEFIIIPNEIKQSIPCGDNVVSITEFNNA